MNSGTDAFDVAAFTHQGAVRGHNEDTIGVAGEVFAGDLDAPFTTRLGGKRHLFVVADGMGGHAHGELASRAGVESLNARAAGIADAAGWREALISVNAEIYDLMRRRPEATGMGTTVVGAVVGADDIVHFNIGDSRAYHFRPGPAGEPGALSRLSHDDVPFPGGAGRHRVSHALTQCLGGFPSPLPIEPHTGTRPALAPGEALLLCSDGLTDMVDDEEIARALEEISDAGKAAQALFDHAMHRGGDDNISIVIVRA